VAMLQYNHRGETKKGRVGRVIRSPARPFYGLAMRHIKVVEPSCDVYWGLVHCQSKVKDHVL